MARVSIEDCLLNMENRFALVTVAADRARQLMDGADPKVNSRNREGVTALREIAEGLVKAKNPVRPVEAPAMEEAPVESPIKA